jgi:hypothetical protein
MVQLGDLIIMIERYETYQMNTGEITQLLARLRKKTRDGVIHITLLSPIKKNGIPCDIEKAEKIQTRQDYLLESGAVILGNGIVRGHSCERSLPEINRNYLICATSDDEEAAEESIHLLGSLENGVSFSYDDEGQESFPLLEDDSDFCNRKVVILDERELPPTSSYVNSDEEGVEKSFHLLGGLDNDGSYNYDDEGQESL